MPESGLHGCVQRWQRGDGRAFEEAYRQLWEKLHPVAVFFLQQFVDRDQAQDLASEAFWAALEEMDLKVSGGRLLMKPTDTTKCVSQSDGKVLRKRVFIGKVSARELTERERLEWCGEKEFQALFRKMWIARGRDVLPGRAPQDLLQEAAEGEDAPQEPATQEAEISIVEWVAGLGQISEQLRYQGQEALARIVECLILYVKLAVAKSNPRHGALGIEQLQKRTVESLLADSHIPGLDFDEAWRFVQQTLNISPDSVYQNKRRLFVYLASLRAVPPVLQKGLGLLWLREMRTWVADCANTVAPLQQQGHADEAQVLQVVECYLRWTFAQGHPTHRRAHLTWIRCAMVDELFKVNNPALLVRSYPDGDHFRQFVRSQYAEADHQIGQLARLQQAIDKMSPRPIRLVTLLNALLPSVEARAERGKLGESSRGNERPRSQ